MNVIFNQAYAPSQAEDGKFVPINAADLTSLGYPASGFGKFAMLVYNVNGAGVTTAPATSSAASIDILSQRLTAQAVTFNATTNYNAVELFNNSAADTIYVVASTTTLAGTTALGIPVLKQTGYRLEATIPAFTVATIGSDVDVRIVAYK